MVKFKNMLTLLFLFYCFVHEIKSESCIFSKDEANYDLSNLNWGVWNFTYVKNNTLHFYYLSLCDPIKLNDQLSTCNGALLCQTVSNQTQQLIGSNSYNYSINVPAFHQIDGFWIVFTQDTCVENPAKKFQMHVYFTCSDILGSPELTIIGECSIYAEWKTSVACQHATQKQVPCYVVEPNGDKRDLSPLIKTPKPFVVERRKNASANKYEVEKIMFSICSELKPDKRSPDCPKGASVCRLEPSKPQDSALGYLKSPLQTITLSSIDLILTYEGQFIPDCNKNFSTVIHFVCPNAKKIIHKEPITMISSKCYLVILFETIYACPEHLITSTVKDCKFTFDKHGIAIDLNPLRDNIHNFTFENKTFAISVCGNLGAADQSNCGDFKNKKTSICMVEKNNSFPIGLVSDSTLRYNGEAVELISNTIFRCTNNSSNYKSSLIRFECDESKIGKGEVSYFEDISDCSHVFTWKTSYACPLKKNCYLTDNDKSVDLTYLKTPGGWQVLYADFPFINMRLSVCGHLDNSTCLGPSALCSNEPHNKTINYGIVNDSPKYDSQKGIVTLKYVKGDFCDGKGIVEMDIICKKGAHISSPRVLYKTECYMKIVWYLETICPEESIIGEDCMVKDLSQDIDIDLTRLSQSKPYIIKTPTSQIYFSLCKELTNSPCKGKGLAVCKETLPNKDPTAAQSYGSFLGSYLSYGGGMLILKYLNGDEAANKSSFQTQIVFICDPIMGVGEPQFVEEIENELIIFWHTSMACSKKSKPSSCFIMDSAHGNIYDLSELGTRSVTITTDTNTTRYYVNVCDHLHKDQLCASNASVCSVNIVNDIEYTHQPNLGTLSELHFTPKRLEYKFSNGFDCQTKGITIPYTTYVYLQCSHNNYENDLQLLEPQSQCSSKFLWTAPEACPVQMWNDSKHPCLIDEGDYHLDLRALADRGSYTVKNENETFTFNVCGPLKDSACNDKRLSVCEHGSSPHGFALASTMKVSYDPFDLYNPSLVYTSKGISNTSEYIFEVQLVCPTEILPDGQAQLKSRTKTKVEVEVASFACRSKRHLCHFTDQYGDYFDLRPLSKQFGNYEYYFNNESLVSINFCNQVQRSPELCPAGFHEACLTNGNEKLSLGQMQQYPEVTETGDFLIRFTEGSVCKGEELYEIEMLLKCSNYEGGLVLMEAKECKYYFYMATKYACPKKSIEGKSDTCKVKSPLSNFIVDLNPLKNSTYYTYLDKGGSKYLFNICGPLNGPNVPKNCQGASVCLVQGSTDEGTIIGMPSAKLRHLGDKIQLNYINGSACEDTHRSTQISFTCKTDKSRNIAISTDTSGCSTYINMPTIHACEAVMEANCQLFHNGQLYDLSPLSGTGMRLDEPTVLFDKQMGFFIFDICQAINLSYDFPCPADSGACILLDSPNPGGQRRAVHLGKVSSPRFENNKLVLEYKGGDICKDNMTYSTRFEFVCSDNVGSHPTFLLQEDCIFQFEWATPAACSITKRNQTVQKFCMIEDTEIGFTYNMGSLSEQIHEFHYDKYLLQVSVCSLGESKTECGENTGICQIDRETGRKWKLGDINPNLNLNQNSPYLNYTSGDLCHQGKYKRKTIINFVCSHQKQEGLHFMYEEKDCTYHFVWYTLLACRKVFSCQLLLNDEMIDLEPLIDPDHGFHIADNNIGDSKTYLVNVCGPIKYEQKIACPIDAGICQVPTVPGESPISLGKFHFGLISSFEAKPVLLYVNGSACESKPGERYRSKIDLKCNQNAHQGNPVLLNYNKDYCTYEFVWETALACDYHKGDIIDDSCILEYQDHIFDLTGLAKPSTDPYTVVDGQDSYLINVCGLTSNVKSSKCGGAAVCHLENNQTMSSLGSKNNSSLYFDSTRLILYYKNGEDCPTSLSTKKSSEIIFDCNHAITRGAPVLVRNSRCHTIFRWETSAACMEQMPKCEVVVNGREFDLRNITTISDSYYTSKGNYEFWINICYPVKQANCPPESIACFKDSYNSQTHSLGKYTTQYVDVNDKGNLVLRYFKGSHTCPNGKESNTEITLACGDGFPTLEYTGFDSKACTWKFSLTSKFICQDQNISDLEEKNGLVFDPMLSAAINLTNLFNWTYSVSGVTKGDLYMYKINLNSTLTNITSDDCKGASICQTKSLSEFHRNIGSTISRRIVKHGQHISIIFTSHGRGCGKNDKKNVTTMFFLSCDSTRAKSSPSFVYESNNCDYLFEWDTSEVCYKNMIKMSSAQWEALYKEDSIPPSTSKVGLILGISIILVCLVTLLFFIYFKKGGNLSPFRECFRRMPVRTVSYKRVVNQAYMNNNDSQLICDFENEDPVL